jgi:hypothetical protein
MFKLSTKISILAIVCSFNVSGLSQHHAGDILLYLENSTIITAMEDDDEVIPWRVFGSEFGEDPDAPYFTDEPGFDSEAGTFPVPSSVGFNIQNALLAWNGNGFSDTDSTMTIKYIFQEVTSGGGFVPGFGIPVSNDGSWHKHLGFILNGPNRSDPADGIYLLELTLWNSDPSVYGSVPFYMVFNNGMPDDLHDEVMDWVQDNIVPEPVTLLSLGVLSIYALRKRRK